ncbi:MAG: putative MFS family arabinose efflux permease [Planctomycetota bacterium]|jgi:predicted MFS family arabinose efflux permease
MKSASQISSSQWRTPLIVIIAGCLIAMVGFGVRSSFGMFLEPMTVARGWNRETFAFAMALQNLLWGIGVPIASAISDRMGPSKVIAFGAVLYALGTLGMAEAESGFALHMTAGIICGLGVAFTAFSIALAAIANVVGPERRSMALGLGTAAGSFGQVIFSPIALSFISAYGWHSALWILGSTALVIIPLALCLPNSSASSSAKESQHEQSLRQAVEEAARHRGFVLLAFGFFVCGFHVAFITVHFPAYIKDLGLDARVGAYAISIIGLCNIFGSLAAGYVGQRWSKKGSLSFIYFTRAIVIAILLASPKTEMTIYLFSMAMGILWLATVPLTFGIVAQIFGMRYMATLVGLVFFSHQIGSFSGIWLGGYLYDSNGSYDPIWWAGIVLGVLAAIIHFPIDERPVDRLVYDSS